MSDLILFLGYSVIWLPLITGISWVLFRGLYKGHEGSRAPLVVLSCVAVTGGFIALQLYGSHSGLAFRATDIYEMIDGAIAIIIGLLLWGKPEKEATL